MKAVVVALCASVTMGSALAADIPNYSCSRPIIPNKQASELVMQRFNKKADTYEKCVAQFVTDQRAIAASSGNATAAKPASDAAEAAIVEYNAFVAEATPPQDGDGTQSMQSVTQRRLLTKPSEQGNPSRH